ncbi:MAG: TSUP family transporter [Oscillospiraceae bacterium]
MILSYIAAFLTGILAAMGVGGGMILIVYLTFFVGIPQLSAQGINLIYFIPIAILSVIIHTKNKLIEWKKIIPSLISGTAFAVLGAFAADYLGSQILGKIFGGFIILIGIKELWGSFNTAPDKSLDKKSV